MVEPKPGETAPPATSRTLAKRIRQQELLAEIGVTALKGSGFERLLMETARLTADGMEAEFCKILELIPGENRFLVRAGVGWEPGIVGKAKVGADLELPAGFALQTGQPVISNHLENEQRFRTPELLVRHGIHRAINVILQGDGRPFGVLEVDSRWEDEFTAHDLTFLQGAANVLGHGDRARAKGPPPQGGAGASGGTAQGDHASGQEQSRHCGKHVAAPG